MVVENISVLMPVRNAEATLAATLESLKRQSRPGFELVVVDDGSTDRTLQILKEHWPASGRLKLLQPGQVGLVEALALGLEECGGEWVVRMDADDIAAPHRLEVQSAMARKHPALDIISARIRSWKTSVSEPLGEGYRRYDEWINGLLEHQDILRERLGRSNE